MDLVDGCLEKTLEKWASSKPENFPTRDCVKKRYDGIKNGLSEFNQSVNIGATVSDGIVLTDHGPAHIKKVIERASKLLENANLSPYEVYILLVAIQLHDLGNYYGRLGHENKIPYVIEEKRALFGSDQFEVKTIQSIAMVHGGTVGGTGDKDTIIELDHSHRHEASATGSVRPRVLAAILRFADELADDKSRANEKMLRDGTLPKECEIYHAYAASLQSVEIISDAREIRLHFSIESSSLCKRFGKNKSNVYLIDEIFERILKMHLERCYCMQFSRPDMEFDKISCEIKIFKNLTDPHKHSPDELIKFDLADSGYPNEPTDGIYSLCPEIRQYKGSGKLTGSLLSQKYSPYSI